MDEDSFDGDRVDFLWIRKELVKDVDSVLELMLEEYE